MSSVLHPEQVLIQERHPKGSWESAQVTEGLPQFSELPLPRALVTLMSHLPSCVSEGTMAVST